MRISDVKALVTGGASGLGLAVAQRLVADGGHVALLDLNEGSGRAQADALGPRARFVPCDVADEASVDAAVAAAAEALGGLDVAVSCAGVLGAGRALGKEGPMPLAQFERTLRVNLVGSFAVATRAAARMQRNAPGPDGERGVIVNTASIAAFEGQIGQAAYAASKAGVVGLTLPLAREFARIGVRVVTIAPGIFRTPMVEGVPPAVYESLCQQVPYPARLGDPEEFADAVVFAIGNRYLNGSTLRLDGAVRLQPK